MPAEGRDVSYLWDMLEAAKTILGFMRDVTLEAYRADLMRRLAVERDRNHRGGRAPRQRLLSDRAS